MPYKTIAVAAVFAVSSSGMAAELAKSGAFEGRFYSHIVQKIEDLETADGMKSYVNESFTFHAGNPAWQPSGRHHRALSRLRQLFRD